MTPIAHFLSVWDRCNHLTAIHSYLATQLTAALNLDELFRAEWVSRVSAMDLYVHELVAQQMGEIFKGTRPTCPGFMRFNIAGEVLMRIRLAPNLADESSAFDLEARSRLGFLTFQDPEKIAEGIRLISDIALWNEIAIYQGASAASQGQKAKALKLELSLIVERRNKIAHEGDLQPGVPRIPWIVQRADLLHVSTVIRGIVDAIEHVV